MPGRDARDDSDDVYGDAGRRASRAGGHRPARTRFWL